MRDLSVLIPSRNEQFLKHTILDVLSAIEADTEIIVVCDGVLPVEPIEDHSRVKLVLLPKAIGQRAATNTAARLSDAKYILKLDAHCRVSKGFDAALIQDCQPDWMLIPLMYNLHVFDWQCVSCGVRTYQGPLPDKCLKCGNTQHFDRVMVWEPRWSRKTESYRMDNELRFGYWKDAMKRPDIQAQGDIHDTMSFLGACQFMEREYFWKLGGCDLGHGGSAGWGQWATEWALKVALSGGRIAVTRHAWFSHLFRSNAGKGFGFPFPISGKDQENARKYSRNLWTSNQWSGQRYPLSAWIERWWPVPGWTEEDLARLKTSGVAFCLQPGKSLGSVSQISSSLPRFVADFTPTMAVDGSRQNMTVGAGDLIPLVVPVATRQESSGSLSRTPPALPVCLADGADATGVRIREVPSRRQPVTPDAACLSPIDGGDSLGTGEIIEMRVEDQMDGIATRRIVTDDMVKFRNVSSITEGDRTNKPRPHQSRQSEAVVACADPPPESTQADLSIPVSVATSIPNPAIGNRINGDVAKDASNFFDSEKRNGEILLSCHDSTSNVESGIGSESPDTRSGPSILTRTRTAGIIYYSDCLLADPIMEACQRQLKLATNPLPLICVSLGKAIDFGDENIILDRQRGVKTLFLQILAGLERSKADFVFLAEHDVLYPPEHFNFMPPSELVFYYDTAMYRVSAVTGRAVTYQTKELSGLCANRLLLVEHFYRRLAKMSQATRELIARGAKVKLDGHNRDAGWEPGNPPRQKHRIDDYKSETWASSVPYIDIRDHGTNWTPTRWEPSQFKDPTTCLGWRELQEGEDLPGWGKPVGRFAEFLAEIAK